MRSVLRPNRRSVLKGSAAAWLAGSFGVPAMPALSRAGSRPSITHGLQSGDVGSSWGVVWARVDRPSRLFIDVATTDSFKAVARTIFADALPEGDMTAKVVLENLPSGQDIFYRVRSVDLSDANATGEPTIGRFRTAPADKRDVSFVWSGDTTGQGWGIDEARGGYLTYLAMLRHRPDFFMHSGDTIYADGPIASEVKLPDGTLWRNVLTEEKSKVAETLAEFRGNYKYNLLDRNVRAFNAEVPIFAQWDDHEVTNNWSPSKSLESDKRYTEKALPLLAARAARAFHEYMPIAATPAEAARVYRQVSYGPLLDLFFLDMRTYRGPNGPNRQPIEGPETVFLGADQLTWLKRALISSRATWKVIAADMPLGLIVYDDFTVRSGSEAVAQGSGLPLGRELEIANLLSFIKQARIRNTVWLTADVHYTAAHFYDPGKARFQEFEPFWEFVSGPLQAGTFGPNELDDTFGPQLRFIKAPADGQAQNLSPAAGLQFFGLVRIDGATEQMTVSLRDASDADLWRTTLDPRFD